MNLNQCRSVLRFGIIYPLSLPTTTPRNQKTDTVEIMDFLQTKTQTWSKLPTPLKEHGQSDPLMK